MQMAMADGMIRIRDPNEQQKGYIKSWRFVWNRQEKWYEGMASLENLNRLASIVSKLPPSVEAERVRMAKVQEAVDRERNKPDEEVKPMVDYPVTKNLYTHQTRAANMALLTFGLVEPKEVDS